MYSSIHYLDIVFANLYLVGSCASLTNPLVNKTVENLLFVLLKNHSALTFNVTMLELN